ncbi:MAG: hypothetical protein WAX44_01690 [Minisyncoccia bacterium]
MSKFFFYIFIPVLVIITPIFFFGKVFLSGDTLHYVYPAVEFFQNNYLSGLNPNLYLGFPVASSFHYAFFNPVYLLIFGLFDFLTGFNLVLAFDIFLGALFFYFFARNLSFDKEESTLASITYIFSQFSTFWFASLTISNGLFILPAICFVVCKITTGKRWYFLLLSVILGYAFLSSHTQFIVMAFVGGAVFLLYRIWEMYDSNISIFKNFTPIFLYFLGLVGGVILGAPQILNILRFFKYITRSDFITFDYIKILDPLKYLLPSFNVYKLTSQEFLPYVGLIPLFLILYAVIYKVRTDKKIFFYSASFVLFFSLMIKYSPTAYVLKHLPVFQYFSQPVRWLYVGNLFLALLSGVGLRLLRENKESEFFKTALKYYKKTLILVVFLFILLNALGYFFGTYFVSKVQNYFDLHLYAKTSQLSTDYYHNIIKVLVDGIIYNFSFTNPNVLLFFSVVVSFYILLKYFRNSRFFVNNILILVIFNLLGSFFINTKFTDKNQVLNKPDFVKFIQDKEKDTNSFRVFSYAIPDAQYKKIAAIYPNESLEIEKFAIEGIIGNTNDLALVGGLEPNGDKKVQQIIYFYLNQKEDNFDKKIPILSAINTKYIVTPYILNSKGLSLATSTSVTKFNVPLYLYENKNALPRVYLSKKVTYLNEGEDKKNLSLVLDDKNDFSKITFIECDTCSDYVLSQVSTDSASVLEYNNEYIRISVKSRLGGWVVIGNANVLGWTASVDGVDTKIYPANYILQGVYLSGGERLLELSHKTIWYPSI